MWTLHSIERGNQLIGRRIDHGNAVPFLVCHPCSPPMPLSVGLALPLHALKTTVAVDSRTIPLQLRLILLEYFCGSCSNAGDIGDLHFGQVGCAVVTV